MEKDFEGHSDERSGRPEGNRGQAPRRSYRRYDEGGETAGDGSNNNENGSERGGRPHFSSNRPYRSNGYRSGGYHSDDRRSGGYRSDSRRPYGDRDGYRPRRNYNNYDNAGSEAAAAAAVDGTSSENQERPRRSFDNRRQGGYSSGGYRSNGYHSDNRERRPYGDRPDNRERRPYGDRPEGGDRERRPYGDRDGYRPRRSYGEHSDNRRPYGDRSEGGDRERRPYGDRGGYRPRRSYGDRPYDRKPYRRPSENSAPQPVSTEPKDPDIERLNKFIANSGLCSRREADQYIQAGVVTVNGEVITTLGTKINVHDDIRFNGERIKGEENVYLLMNKPKGYETTTSDPHAEKTVMDLIDKEQCPTRVYPVGRLDKDSTGVLLFTNDGDLTQKLTHPSYNKKKIYEVRTDKEVTKNDFDTLLKGVELEDGTFAADQLSYVDDKMNKLGIEIHSGANRIVRRMFEALGYQIKSLDRVFFAGMTKGKLRRGAWRPLTEKEVSMLKSGSYE